MALSRGPTSAEAAVPAKLLLWNKRRVLHTRNMFRPQTVTLILPQPRLVCTLVRTWDSSPDLSPFLLDLDLGRCVTKSTFNFHCAHLRWFFWSVTSYSSLTVLYWLLPAVRHVLHQRLKDGLEPFCTVLIFCCWYILHLRNWSCVTG